MTRALIDRPPKSVWVDWIQTVAGKAPTISQAEYDKGKPPGAPCARTLARWAGKSWSEVCADAGKSAGGASPLPWAPSAKLAALRAAAAGLDPAEHLTFQRYHDWRAAQADPSLYPSALAFGDADWIEWCMRAGVSGAKHRRRHQYPDALIVEHLAAAAAHGGGHVGTTRYEQYRRAHPDAPSRTAIIARYKQWHLAVAAAQGAG